MLVGSKRSTNYSKCVFAWAKIIQPAENKPVSVPPAAESTTILSNQKIPLRCAIRSEPYYFAFSDTITEPEESKDLGVLGYGLTMTSISDA